MINNQIIISAEIKEKPVGSDYRTDAIEELCSLLTSSLRIYMNMLRKNAYNDFVSTSLPFQFRTGVIKRNILWTAFPEMKENIFDGIESEKHLK